jgi:hypothetical protein
MCMVDQENRIIKTKWWDEFSQQSYDTVERGVFRKLTVKEMVNYSGPVNYIFLVEALKGPSHEIDFKN